MGDNRDVRQREDCQERAELVRNAGGRERERDEASKLPWLLAGLAPRGRKGQREPEQQRDPGDRSVPLLVGDEDLAPDDPFCISSTRECRFWLVVAFCAHRRLPPWTTRVETWRGLTTAIARVAALPGGLVRHGDANIRPQPALSLERFEAQVLRGQGPAFDNRETVLLVEGSVPRNVTKRPERNGWITALPRPAAHHIHERRTDPLTTMRREHVQFLEVRIAIDFDYQGKSNWSVAGRDCYPKVPRLLGRCECLDRVRLLVQLLRDTEISWKRLEHEAGDAFDLRKGADIVGPRLSDGMRFANHWLGTRVSQSQLATFARPALAAALESRLRPRRRLQAALRELPPRWAAEPHPRVEHDAHEHVSGAGHDPGLSERELVLAACEKPGEQPLRDRVVEAVKENRRPQAHRSIRFDRPDECQGKVRSSEPRHVTEEPAGARVSGSGNQRCVVGSLAEPHDHDAPAHAGRVESRLEITPPADLLAKGRGRADDGQQREVDNDVQGDLRTCRPSAGSRAPVRKPRQRRDEIGDAVDHERHSKRHENDSGARHAPMRKAQRGLEFVIDGTACNQTSERWCPHGDRCEDSPRR